MRLAWLTPQGCLTPRRQGCGHYAGPLCWPWPVSVVLPIKQIKQLMDQLSSKPSSFPFTCCAVVLSARDGPSCQATATTGSAHQVPRHPCCAIPILDPMTLPLKRYTFPFPGYSLRHRYSSRINQLPKTFLLKFGSRPFNSRLCALNCF